MGQRWSNACGNEVVQSGWQVTADAARPPALIVPAPTKVVEGHRGRRPGAPTLRVRTPELRKPTHESSRRKEGFCLLARQSVPRQHQNPRSDVVGHDSSRTLTGSIQAGFSPCFGASRLSTKLARTRQRFGRSQRKQPRSSPDRPTRQRVLNNGGGVAADQPQSRRYPGTPPGDHGPRPEPEP